MRGSSGDVQILKMGSTSSSGIYIKATTSRATFANISYPVGLLKDRAQRPSIKYGFSLVFQLALQHQCLEKTSILYSMHDTRKHARHLIEADQIMPIIDTTTSKILDRRCCVKVHEFQITVGLYFTELDLQLLIAAFNKPIVRRNRAHMHDFHTYFMLVRSPLNPSKD